MSALFRLFKLIAPLTGIMLAAICLGVLGQLTVIALPVIAITGLLTDHGNFMVFYEGPFIMGSIIVII